MNRRNLLLGAVAPETLGQDPARGEGVLPCPFTSALAVPSATAFETDLRAARDARGTTLDQIQQQTRIPVDVLRRFEEGHLLQDETYNDVYLRAFLKSYAQAVGLSQADTLAAYELHRAGRYDGRLQPGYEPSDEPPPVTPPALATPEADIPDASPDAPLGSTAPPAPAAPAVEALRQQAPTVARSSTPPVTGTRVSRPAVPGARRSFDKNWGTILGFFVVFVLLLGGALWALVFRGGDAPENDVPLTATGDAAAIDSAGIGAGAAAGGPRLQLPIRVSVAAGGDGLQSFRVTADGGDRRPYWINAGESQVFSGDSVLVLWGEGDSFSFDEAILELQGQRWTPRSGQPVRLDPQRGQALLDSLAQAPAGPASTSPATTLAP